MNTDDLIRVLSRDASPPRTAAPLSGLALAVLAGAVVSFAILAVWLGFRNMALAVHTAPYWMKAGYTFLMLLMGLAAAAALARPGGQSGWRWTAAAVGLFALLLALGIAQAARAPEASRAALWLGHTWNVCPWRILGLAAPIYLAVGLAMRRFAPTSLTRAGAAAGLAAGGAAATIYGLACTETAAAFVAVWYTAGIAACTALGAFAGRWLLRW